MKRFGSRQLHSLRISMYAVGEVLIVQVGPGGEAGHSDITNDIALLHVGADVNIAREARHVAVKSRDIAAVGKHHGVPVSAALARKTNPAIARGMHRRAGWRRIVGAHVPTNGIQDRMLAV